MKIVLDTNVLLISIPKKSNYRLIFDELILGQYNLIISNEILSEYIEKLQEKTNYLVANNISEFLINSRFVKKIDVYFRWELIKIDSDDNKFVDCAIAGNVDYIVSNDHHFNELMKVDFPKVRVINSDEFLNILEKDE